MPWLMLPAIVLSADVVGAKDKKPDALPIIAHFSFDKDRGSKVIDSGPNRLHGKATGKTPEKVRREPGMIGKALALAPDHRCKVELPQSPHLDLKPPFTIAAWIKRTGKKPSSMEILCRGWDTGKTGYRLRYGWRMIYFIIGDGEKTVTLSTPEHAIENDKWVHVAATHDGKWIRLFLNAEPVAALKTAAAPAKAKQAPVIGNYVGRPDAYPFVGLIDDLYIIGKALSGEELFDLAEPPSWREGKKGPSPRLPEGLDRPQGRS